MMAKAEDDGEDAEHGDFGPGFGARLDIGAVAEDADVFLFDVEEREAAGVAEEGEDGFARGVDPLAEDEFNGTVGGSLRLELVEDGGGPSHKVNLQKRFFLSIQKYRS